MSGAPGDEMYKEKEGEEGEEGTELEVETVEIKGARNIKSGRV